MPPLALIPNSALVSRPGHAGSEQATKPSLSRIQKRPTKITCLKPPAITTLALALVILAVVLLQTALAANTWKSTGSLASDRLKHTATLLADGRVLVAGGFAIKDGGLYEDYLESAELYDPATGFWSVTGVMPRDRWFHTATLLTDGWVLVAGGYADGNYLDSVDPFKPATGIWTATHQLNYSRSEHTSTLLANGRVLVVGGRDATTTPNTAELFDPEIFGFWSWDWAPWCRLHTTTRLADGRVLVVGGYPYVDRSLNIMAYLYNPATGTWSESSNNSSPPPPGLSHGHAAEGRPGRRGEAAFATAMLYDPATRWWSVTGVMTRDRAPRPRCWPTAGFWWRGIQLARRRPGQRRAL